MSYVHLPFLILASVRACLKAATFFCLQTCLPISFDKAQVGLEFKEFAFDGEVSALAGGSQDAVAFWKVVLDMQSPMGERKYINLATLPLHLLAIPASNADSEKVSVWYGESKQISGRHCHQKH